MEYLLLGGAVIGAVELIKRAFDKDYRTVTIIAVAGLIGALYGWLGIEAASAADGLVAGFAASGVVTLAAKVGKES